ncbi:hypothetical protein HU200_003260 [Digitaria exilis]|uniref:Uncharacterized protein n=1 Tax=Digitaria exilis TaxID=1010633 RepID=A0A835KT64_9POAL|nr:hypothetical protein HU200_003260 [Digitaria exilis]
MTYMKSIDDSNWVEVVFINGYAIFMGYLMMGIRGLGVLVVTWTTVVVLGGFVSVLGKKDFWCLTGITLVQIAGYVASPSKVFNFLSRDKLSDIIHLSWGLLGAVVATVSRVSITKCKTRDGNVVSIPRRVVALGLSALQLLVFSVILCPLALLFVFGLYISATVSLWRLIEHDFSNTDGGSNLKPALEVMYGLAATQGILIGYRTLHYFGAKIGLVDFVAQHCSVDKKLVSEYLKNTVAGCEKDPSLATGRNLVTYGVDLMAAESNSNSDSFIVGVRVLGSRTTDFDEDRQVLIGRLLTRSASSGHMIKRLLEILGPRSHYEVEDMEPAARVLALAARNIHLPRFTEMIPSICGLLDTLKLKKSGEKPLGVATKVARILRNLATEEDNCRIISSAEGVLTNAVRYLTSAKNHRKYKFHDAWCSMADEWLEFISRLTGAPGFKTAAATNEISGKLQEIQPTIQSILECTKCDVSLKRQAVKVLLYLAMDTPSSITASPSTREIFTWMLLHISAIDDFDFFDHTCDDCTPRLHMRNDMRQAGKKLKAMVGLESARNDFYFFDRTCDHGTPRLHRRFYMRQKLACKKLKAMVGLESDVSTLESVSTAIGKLARIIVSAEAGNSKYRLLAVQVLRDVCCNSIYYQVTALNKALLEVMPEVILSIPT